MGEQQSQKRGAKSDTQKGATAHRENDPIPASNAAGGAFGKDAPDKQSDKDAALAHKDSRLAQRKKPWNEREKSENV